MDVISYVLSKKYTDEKCKEMDNIFQDYKNQSMLKTIGIEKELNDFKNTLHQVNVNQEAKQSTSGHGIVDLPKNAANGQVSSSIFGNTITNLIEDNTVSPFTKELDSTKTYLLIKTDGGTVNIDGADTAVPTKITGLTSTTLAWDTGNIGLYELLETEISMDVAELTQKYTYVSGTKSTVSAMRITSENEDKTEKSQAYIIAKDRDNKIVNLRSLPNGVADEIDLDKGELIKRVSDEVTLDGSESWVIVSAWETTNTLAFSLYIGSKKSGYYVYNNRGLVPVYPSSDNEGYVLGGAVANIAIKINKSKLATQDLNGFKQYLSENPITLIYQLAEPEIIPIQVSGNIVSNPSGTIYIEPAVADANVYNDGIAIFEQELNIDYIDKLSKVDYKTGVETEIDASKCIISEDKKSFTHPELQNGDMVFFEYYYSNETTQGETTIEYYDSRYVIPDKTLPNKFYKWDIEVDNGVPSVAVTEV